MLTSAVLVWRDPREVDSTKRIKLSNMSRDFRGTSHQIRILELADVRSKLLLLFVEIPLLILPADESVDTEERLDLLSCLVVLQEALRLQTYQLSRAGEQSDIRGEFISVFIY